MEGRDTNREMKLSLITRSDTQRIFILQCVDMGVITPEEARWMLFVELEAF